MRGTYLVQTTTSVKICANYGKKSSKFTKKFTHVDDMMIHNPVKYLIPTRIHLWDIKITNFKPERCPQNLLEICYFYISLMNSSLDKIFYRVVYHHIIYMCEFFGEFRWLFCHGLHRFSRRLWFALDMFPYMRFVYKTHVCCIFVVKIECYKYVDFDVSWTC